MFHSIKVKKNKFIYAVKLLNWARTHAKEVENYKFLTELRKVAYDKMLKMEREQQLEKAKKLEIQVKLIDKILNYVHR